jgi:hypothetical protein
MIASSHRLSQSQDTDGISCREHQVVVQKHVQKLYDEASAELRPVGMSADCCVYDATRNNRLLKRPLPRLPMQEHINMQSTDE